MQNFFVANQKSNAMMGERILFLDFIRAISILLIITFHYNYHALRLGVAHHTVFWKQASSFLDYAHLGVIGVSLFIILSGTSLMASTKENFEVKTFFLKRFYSIYPLFWSAYAAAFVTLFVIHQESPVRAHPPLTFILTLMGLDGFLLYKIPNFYLVGEWFLGFIIIMYVFFPFLRKLFLADTLLTFLFCVSVMLFVDRFYRLNMDILRFPPSRLLEFVFGMSFIYLFKPSQKLSNCFLMGISGLVFYLTAGANMPVLFKVSIWGICIFTVLACISSFIDNLIIKKIIVFFSRYSYGAFLIHHILLTQLLPLFMNRQLNLLGNYFLFFILLILIYTFSLLLTNATVVGMKKMQNMAKLISRFSRVCDDRR